MASIALTNITLLGALLLVPALFGSFTAYQIGLYLIYGIAAQGIGYLWGRTGILPLGQALFFGVSAYAGAHVLLHFDNIPTQILYFFGVICLAAIIAFFLASIVFKGRKDSGPFFSLITLAMVMISEQVAGTAPNITGGFNGLSGFEAIAGLDQFGGFYYVVVACVIISTTLLMLLDRLPIGLIARAVADNEQRLQLLGFRTHLIKGAVFALSAGLAALAGILFANHQGIVTPTSTGFLLSANLVIWTAVGGRNHVLGPLLGAILIGYLSSELRDSFKYWEVGLACLFILVVVKAPGGIAELLAKSIGKFVGSKENISTFLNDVPATKFRKMKAPVQFRNVKVSVGAASILNGVDFTTPTKGILCVIGPNGAGKTSILNALTGGLPVRSGCITIDGNPLENQSPDKALLNGVGRKLQVPSVFFAMTVRENLRIAMLAGRVRLSDYFRPAALNWRSEEIERLLATPSLPLLENMNNSVSVIAQGHRQFLEFAMTTAAQPQTLLLDEPCAGLSPAETQLMTKLVKDFQIQNDGLVILIEHDMSIVQALADQVLVLHQGSVLSYGTYDEIKSDSAVQSVYVGGRK